MYQTVLCLFQMLNIYQVKCKKLCLAIFEQQEPMMILHTNSNHHKEIPNLYKPYSISHKVLSNLYNPNPTYLCILEYLPTSPNLYKAKSNPYNPNPIFHKDLTNLYKPYPIANNPDNIIENQVMYIPEE